VVNTLIVGEPFHAVVDQRMNSVTVTGTSGQLRTAETLLLHLTEAVKKPLEIGHPSHNTDSKQLDRQINLLRSDYAAADKIAHQLADSLRHSPDAAKQVELQHAVRSAFALRQEMLRAELTEMQSRQLQTQQSIEWREQKVDQIVDRRMEELLNPHTNWDGKPDVAESVAITEQSAASPIHGGRLAIPEAIMLSGLEGTWNVEQAFEEEGKDTTVAMKAVIQGNRIRLSSPEGSSRMSFDLKFGGPGPPQQVDLHPILGPDDLLQIRESNAEIAEFGGIQLSQHPVFFGIIEVDEDHVRLCVTPAPSGQMQRPTQFVVSPTSCIWELERRDEVSELEGEWHQVAPPNSSGQSEVADIRPYNRTYRGDRATTAWSGGGHECRFEANPEARTIRSYSKEEDGSFFLDYYELTGDQLILRDSPDDANIKVFERGHVRIPTAVPPASREQQLRWRSGIVDIWVSGNGDAPDGGTARAIGRGVVISSTGTVLTHLGGGWGHALIESRVEATFDDGSVLHLPVVEQGGGGLVILKPEEAVDVNHFFPLTVGAHFVHDEFYIGTNGQTDFGRPGITIDKSRVLLTDRRMATGISPVWQLDRRPDADEMGGYPVLSSNGELVAMTLQHTGELLLAVPVTQLMKLFPKALYQLSPADTASSP